MPKYRAKTKHYLNDRMVEADEVVDYDGIPGTRLEPLDAEARKRMEAADKDREKQRKAFARGEPYESELVDHPPLLRDGDHGVPLIKSHPIMPNLKGSSGEIEGVSPVASPEQKAKHEAEVAKYQQMGDRAERAKPARRRPKARGRAAKPPQKAQSTPAAQPDELKATS